MKNVKNVLLMLFIFSFCILGFASKVSEIPKMAFTIVDVEKQGYFNYYGKVSKLIQRGQEVIWICNSQFTIYFGNQSPLVLNSQGKPSWGKITKGIQSSPFNSEQQSRIKQRLEQMKKIKEKMGHNVCKNTKLELESNIKGLENILKRAGSNRYHFVQAWISNNALSGKYKYLIAVLMNGKIWVDDPEDIVEPPKR